MTKYYVIPGVGPVADKESSKQIAIPNAGALTQFPTVAVGGRIMSSQAAGGGLACHGGIAGRSGGLAG